MNSSPENNPAEGTDLIQFEYGNKHPFRILLRFFITACTLTFVGVFVIFMREWSEGRGDSFFKKWRLFLGLHDRARGYDFCTFSICLYVLRKAMASFGWQNKYMLLDKSTIAVFSKCYKC